MDATKIFTTEEVFVEEKVGIKDRIKKRALWVKQHPVKVILAVATATAGVVGAVAFGNGLLRPHWVNDSDGFEFDLEPSDDSDGIELAE